MQHIIPLAPGLLEAIQHLKQPLDRACSACLVSGRLLHVDLLVRIQLSVEVCGVEVECFYVPVVAHGNGEDEAEACEPRNRGVGVIIIDPVNLREASRNQARLVLIYASVRFLLKAEDPLAPDDVLSGQARDRGPSSSMLEQTYLAIHHIFPASPVRARSRLLHRLWVTFDFLNGRGDDLLVPCEVSPLGWIWVVLRISR